MKLKALARGHQNQAGRVVPWLLVVPFAGYNEELLRRMRCWQDAHKAVHGRDCATWHWNLQYLWGDAHLDSYSIASGLLSQLNESRRLRRLVSDKDYTFVRTGSTHADACAVRARRWALGGLAEEVEDVLGQTAVASNT